MIEVRTADLIGPALDWAVAVANKVIPATGDRMFHLCHSRNKVGWHSGNLLNDSLGGNGFRPYCPSTDWSQGGPLIEKYGVLLSPPTSLVHRNFGNWDARNGYYESGFWGATIFAKERKHRRKAFEHPDQPLVVVMRAIVQFELGDVVSVPAELAQSKRGGGE